jgi:hypothetical protein
MAVNETEEFKELAMKELIGKNDFGDAWTQRPGWGHYVAMLYT